MKLTDRASLIIGIWLLIQSSIVYSFSLNSHIPLASGISSTFIIIGAALIAFSFQVKGEEK